MIAFVEGTGYEQDLYRVEAPDDVISPEIESTFMKLVDTRANLALQEFLRHCGSGQPIALTEQARNELTRIPSVASVSQSGDG